LGKKKNPHLCRPPFEEKDYISHPRLKKGKRSSHRQKKKRAAGLQERGKGKKKGEIHS